MSKPTEEDPYVLLWPPDYEDEIWRVIVYRDGKKTDTEFPDHDTAETRAFSVARELGVKVGYPTRDGEIRDLDDPPHQKENR